MGARVSVATSSHAGSAAGRSNAAGGTVREAASPENGFSSQLSAASRTHSQPTPPAGETHSEAGAAKTASSPNPNSSVNPRSTNSKGAGKAPATTSNGTRATATSSDQAQNAAATVAEADVSSIDGDLATQDGKPAEKNAGKSRSDSSAASTAVSNAPTDPATLALMLAAAGVQVGGIGDTGQQGSKGSTPDDQGTEDPAAAAIAGGVAASMVVPAGLGLYAIGVSAQEVAGGQKPGSTTVASPVAADDARSTLQLDAEALQSAGATGEFSSPDASLLNDQASAPALLQSQPTAVTSPNGLPEMMRGLSGVAASTASVDRTVSIPVSDRNWGGAVASQVQWMVNAHVQSATLQLTPEHLGPVEVRIEVQSSQVNVSFTAAHPETRSALEQTVPQLRAILANGGLTLGQSSVQQEARSNSHYTPNASRTPSDGTQTVDSVSISPTRGLGLIDEYA